jgi:hypothetical protein
MTLLIKDRHGIVQCIKENYSLYVEKFETDVQQGSLLNYDFMTAKAPELKVVRHHQTSKLGMTQWFSSPSSVLLPMELQ